MKSLYPQKVYAYLCFLIPCCLVHFTVFATENRLDYMGSDQTYDKISGAFVSPHIPWARPLAGGKLDTIFIVPNSDTREVVELAQRLDLNYKVIMTAKYDSFLDTEHAGRHAVPQYSKLVLTLAKERLHPAINYDLIFIGKLAWKALPDFVQASILERVKNGAGLIYIESSGVNESIEKSLSTSLVPGITSKIYAKIPIDILPLIPVENAKEAIDACKKNTGGNYRDLKEGHKGGLWNKGKAPLTCKAFSYGKGKIVIIDYYEGKRTPQMGNSITPSNLTNNMLQYDLYYALISQFALWASGREFPVIKLVDQSMRVFNRAELDKKELPFDIIRKKDTVDNCKIYYEIRAFDGNVVKNISEIKNNKLAISLFPLPTGKYLVDVWLKDELGNVLDYAATAFSVNAENDVLSIRTDKDRYRKGETVTGEIELQKQLNTGESVKIYVKDAWMREILSQKLNGEGKKFKFSFPVKDPLSSIWDIYVTISDKAGAVAETSCYIGIPNYTIDNYLLSLFYGIDNTPLNQVEMLTWARYGINCA